MIQVLSQNIDAHKGSFKPKPEGKFFQKVVNKNSIKRMLPPGTLITFTTLRTVKSVTPPWMFENYLIDVLDDDDDDVTDVFGDDA